jgi:conjugative transfer signal peptidase TraF
MSTLALVGASRRLRLNVTRSLPLGVYVVEAPAIARGSIVLACLPAWIAPLARRRGYVPEGGRCAGGILPIGKPVLASLGDTVAVTPAGLVVNRRAVPNSRALSRDRQGRVLPRIPLGAYVVRPGMVWLVSTYSPLSFDSRYFGPIPLGNIRAGLAATALTSR